MTEDNEPEKRPGEDWDWQKETRDWSAAASELACFSLARMKGKDLIEIIDTKRGLLRYICIFKDKPQ